MKPEENNILFGRNKIKIKIILQPDHLPQEGKMNETQKLILFYWSELETKEK